MGTTVSTTISRHIEQEFSRVQTKSAQRDWLNLAEVTQMTSLKEYPIDFTHLGTLYVLNQSRDGRFTIHEFYSFASLCCKRTTSYKKHDFQPGIQAFFSLVMWEGINRDGIEDFSNWFAKLFTMISPPKSFSEYPGIKYIDSDVLETLNHIMGMKEFYGVDFQAMLDLMQRVAEEEGLLELSDSRLDHMVPIRTLQYFGSEFAKGFVGMMNQMGFNSQSSSSKNENENENESQSQIQIQIQSN